MTFTSCQKEFIYGGFDYKQLGSSANNFLAATTYTSLVVQVNYMQGYEPSQESLDVLKAFLIRYLNKPEGVTIYKQMIVGTNQRTLSIKDIVSFEKRHRTVFTEGNILSAHILITDGDYNIEELLATSYWNTSFAIFGKNVDRYSGGPGQVSRTKLMSSLLCHEMGHLLGLVNQGTPMLTDHQDRANGAHCSDNNCLMNFEIETTSSGMPTTGPIPSLDNNCHNDLLANGGK